MVKLDATTGAEIWRRVIDGATNGSDYLRDVAVDPAGDVIAVGKTNATGVSVDWLVVKLDGATGATVWSRTMAGGEDDAVGAVAVDGTGNIAVGGSTSNPTAPDFTVRYFSGATGVDLWPPYIVASSIPFDPIDDDAVGDIVIDATGDVLASGRVGGDAFVVRLDADDGSPIWSQSVDTSFALDLAAVADGDVAVATLLSVARLAASDGAIVWQQALSNFTPRALALDADGDAVVVGGRRQTGTIHSDFALAKIDAGTGAVLWHQGIAGFYQSSQLAFDTVTDLVVDPDDRVSAAGTVSRFGLPDGRVVVSVSSRLSGDLRVRDDGNDPTRRKLVLRSKTTDLLAPGAGGPSDPTMSGAMLVVSNPGTLETTTMALPAANWTMKPTDNGIATYRYRDAALAAGPCRAVNLRTGQKLIAKCLGAQITFTLDEPSQSVLDVRLVLGTNDFPYCFTFGPSALDDTSTADGGTASFRVKSAPPPGLCPGE